MKLPMPNWKFAGHARDGYAQDGVKGEVVYDGVKGEWYLEVNDEDYAGYLANIEKRKSEVLKDYCDVLNWGDAVNIQGQIQTSPGENENRLGLYLIDVGCRATRGFKVNATLGEVFHRRSAGMFFGSTCESCGRKMLVVLEWEDVKPKERR